MCVFVMADDDAGCSMSASSILMGTPAVVDDNNADFSDQRRRELSTAVNVFYIVDDSDD